MEVEHSTKILNASELIEHGNIQVTATLKYGAKRNFPEGTLEEERQMKEMWESRKKLCEKANVSNMKRLITAEWNSELKVASTSKLKGKCALFMGTSVKGKFYLSPEETVFLMESGHLELFHCGLPVSIEEALFIAFSEDLSFEKYQVYSYLVKAGFIVIPHRKKLNFKPKENTSNVSKLQRNKKSVQQQLCTISDSKGSDAIDVTNGSQSSKCEVITEEQNENSILHENIVEQNRNTPLNLSVRNSIDFIAEVELSAPYEDIAPENTVNCIEKMDTNAENQFRKVQNTCSSVKKMTHSEFFKELPYCSKTCESASSACCVPDANSNTESVKHVAPEEDQGEKCSKESTQSCILIEDDDYSSSGSSTIIDVDDTIEKIADKSTESNKCIVGTEFEVEESKELLRITSEKNYSTSTCDDEDVVFLEVKKKETKPLAVINIMSDSDSESDLNQGNGDNYNKIEMSMNIENEFISNINPHCGISQQTLNKPNNNLTEGRSTSKPPWPFPNFAGKTVVCLTRPPAELLPPNVTPAKNFYPIDIDILSKSRYTATNEKRIKKWIYRGNYAGTSNSNQPSHIFFNETSVNPSYGVAPRSLMNLIEHAKESSGTCSTVQNIPTEQFCVGQNSLPFLHPNGPFMEYLRTSKQPSTFGLSRNSSEAGLLDSYDNHRNNYACNSNFKNGSLSESSQQDPYQNSYHRKRYRKSRWDEFHFPPSYVRNYDMITNYRNSLSNICHTENINVTFPGKGIHCTPDKSSQSNYRTAKICNDCKSSCKNYTQQDGPRPARPYSRHPPHWQARQRNRPYKNRHQKQWKKEMYPCAVEKVPNYVSSWSEYQSALKKIIKYPVKESIQQPAFKIDEVLWSRDVHPLLSPTDVLPVADVLELLNITQSTNLLTRGRTHFERFPSKIGKLEISFDVFLPRPCFKKKNPGIPRHRIIVTRSADIFPKLNAVVALNKSFNDTATLLFAVVDGGDISFYSFKDISLSTMYPSDNTSADHEKNA